VYGRGVCLAESLLGKTLIHDLAIIIKITSVAQVRPSSCPHPPSPDLVTTGAHRVSLAIGYDIPSLLPFLLSARNISCVSCTKGGRRVFALLFPLHLTILQFHPSIYFSSFLRARHVAAGIPSHFLLPLLLLLPVSSVPSLRIPLRFSSVINPTSHPSIIYQPCPSSHPRFTISTVALKCSLTHSIRTRGMGEYLSVQSEFFVRKGWRKRKGEKGKERKKKVHLGTVW